jgi:transposase-like protein
MRADNSLHVIEAARRRSGDTRKRAVAALRRMDNAGTLVTFDAVAREAGVSRSWLYKQPDLRAEIERLRERQRPAPSRRLPDRQRASDASLLRRLEVATARIRTLEADNRQLREALAIALGERRIRLESRKVIHGQAGKVCDSCLMLKHPEDNELSGSLKPLHLVAGKHMVLGLVRDNLAAMIRI